MSFFIKVALRGFGQIKKFRSIFFKGTTPFDRVKDVNIRTLADQILSDAGRQNDDLDASVNISKIEIEPVPSKRYHPGAA